MGDAADALTLQMLAWIAERPRGYAEVMEAWRTSCPRLSIWEDATLAGLVTRGPDHVTLTARGRAMIERESNALSAE